MRWPETYTVRTRMVRISSSSYQIWWRRSRGLIKRMEVQLICVISSKTQCQMQQLMQSTHMDSSKCPRTMFSLRSPSSRCSRVLESLLLLIRTRVIRIKLSRSQISDSLSASQDHLSLLQMTIRAIISRVSHPSRAPRVISPMLVHKYHKIQSIKRRMREQQVKSISITKKQTINLAWNSSINSSVSLSKSETMHISSKIWPSLWSWRSCSRGLYQLSNFNNSSSKLQLIKYLCKIMKKSRKISRKNLRKMTNHKYSQVCNLNKTPLTSSDLSNSSSTSRWSIKRASKSIKRLIRLWRISKFKRIIHSISSAHLTN